MKEQKTLKIINMGFMHDKIIASHTFWGDTWMSTVKPDYNFKCVFVYYKYTCDTIYTHF